MKNELSLVEIIQRQIAEKKNYRDAFLAGKQYGELKQIKGKIEYLQSSIKYIQRGIKISYRMVFQGQIKVFPFLFTYVLTIDYMPKVHLVFKHNSLLLK